MLKQVREDFMWTPYCECILSHWKETINIVICYYKILISAALVKILLLSCLDMMMLQGCVCGLAMVTSVDLMNFVDCVYFCRFFRWLNTSFCYSTICAAAKAKHCIWPSSMSLNVNSTKQYGLFFSGKHLVRTRSSDNVWNKNLLKKKKSTPQDYIQTLQCVCNTISPPEVVIMGWARVQKSSSVWFWEWLEVWGLE